MELEIVHFGDLHYGDKKEFREEYLLNVIDYINDNRPDAAICAGDFVHNGLLTQYQGIAPYIKQIKVPLMIVPGNHDCKSNGIMSFEKIIGPRRSRLINEKKDSIIVGLDSAKADSSEGEIGDEQLEWCAFQFNQILENRVLTFHHHVAAVPYSGRKQNTLIDAGEVLEFVQLFEIDLVCMGHKHIPYCIEVGNTLFLYCGTASSIKVRAKETASFNHIILEGGNLDVNMVNSSNLEETLLFTKREGLTRFIRPRKTRIEHLINMNIFDERY